MVDAEIADFGAMVVKQIEKYADTSSHAWKTFTGESEDVCVVKPSYAEEVKFSVRCAESRRILHKYPDRIPIICERGYGNSIGEIGKKKFLVPKDLTVGQFVHLIRKRLEMRADEAMFVFVNQSLPRVHASIEEIYAQHRSEDGFLYVKYSGENAFGY